MQGVQQMLDASGVGHRDPSMRVALRAISVMWVRFTQQKRDARRLASRSEERSAQILQVLLKPGPVELGS
jgi:hypothetical protein